MRSSLDHVRAQFVDEPSTAAAAKEDPKKEPSKDAPKTDAPKKDEKAEAAQAREKAINDFAAEVSKLKNGKNSDPIFKLFDAVNDRDKAKNIDEAKFGKFVDDLANVDPALKKSLKEKFAEVKAKLNPDTDGGVRDAVALALRGALQIPIDPNAKNDKKNDKGGVIDPTKGFVDPSKAIDPAKAIEAANKAAQDALAKKLDAFKSDLAKQADQLAKDQAANALKNAALDPSKLGDQGQGQGQGEGKGGGGEGGGSGGGEGGGDKGGGDEGAKTADKGGDTGKEKKRSNTSAPKVPDLAVASSDKDKDKDKDKEKSSSPFDKGTAKETKKYEPAKKDEPVANNTTPTGTPGENGIANPSMGSAGGFRNSGPKRALSPMSGGGGGGPNFDSLAAAQAGAGGGGGGKQGPSVPSSLGGGGGGDDPTRGVGAYQPPAAPSGPYSYVRFGDYAAGNPTGDPGTTVFAAQDNGDDGAGYPDARRLAKAGAAEQVVTMPTTRSATANPERQGVFAASPSISSVCDGIRGALIGVCSRFVDARKSKAAPGGTTPPAGSVFGTTVKAPSRGSSFPSGGLARQPETTL